MTFVAPIAENGNSPAASDMACFAGGLPNYTKAPIGLERKSRGSYSIPPKLPRTELDQSTFH
jgi:hypothetical protein